MNHLVAFNGSVTGSGNYLYSSKLFSNICYRFLLQIFVIDF